MSKSKKMTAEEAENYERLIDGAEQLEIFGKVYGYCRISRKEQSITRQVRNIAAAYPDAIIVEEAWTGRVMNRPKWQKLLNRVKKGDTIVFDSVSRMSRDAEKGIEYYFKLTEAGVNLVFLKEPYINTEVYKNAVQRRIEHVNDDVDVIIDGINAYMRRLAERQVQIAFEQADKEVEDLRQRTREGIQTARECGKQIGCVKGRTLNVKKHKTASETILKHSKDFHGTLSDAECMKLAGISRNTFYKYKRELTQQVE